MWLPHREENLASVPDSSSSEERKDSSSSEEDRKDPTRDELTTNSRSGLKIPSSDPLLNLESSKTPLQLVMKSLHPHLKSNKKEERTTKTQKWIRRLQKYLI